MMKYFRIFIALVSLNLCFATWAQADANAEKEYILGSGDAIRIAVYQNPDLMLETRISETGVVTFPLIGQIKIGELSINQAEQKIAQSLKKGRFLNDPQVNILVIQVRGNQVSILGQVNRPGRYPLDVVNMKFTEVLALAGGVLLDGADKAILTGLRNGKDFKQEIDIPRLFVEKNPSADPVLQNGDVIYIAKAPVIYIYGEVQRPGQLRLERFMNLRQALAAGGGPTLRGTEKGIALHRKDETGKTQILKPQIDDLLQDGDVIYVRESLF